MEGFQGLFSLGGKMMKDMLGNVGQRMVDKFFRRVNDVYWDLMSGRVGIKNDDGINTLEGEGEEAQVVVNMIDDFGVPLPAFAQNTPVKDIKNGDLIYNARKVMGWVVHVPEHDKGHKAFKLLKPDGTRGEWRPPKVASLGLDLSGAMVLRSLVNTLPDGGLGNMQGMLLPLLMMGGESEELEDMLPLLLMSQMGAVGGGGGNMVQTLMMMKMMKGGFGTSKGKRTDRDRVGFFEQGK